MKTANQKRKSKKRNPINYSKIRGLIYLCLAIGFMVSLIRKYQNVVVKAKNEIETLKEEVVKVEKKEVDLNQKFALLDDEDYVVTYARANYIFKRDNEVVAKISQVEE